MARYVYFIAATGICKLAQNNSCDLFLHEKHSELSLLFTSDLSSICIPVYQSLHTYSKRYIMLF